MAISSQENSHIRLDGSRRFQRPGSVTLGPSDPQEWVEVTAKVRRKADLPEPNPDKPISRQELSAKYGADPKDLDAVEKAFTPFGLKVVSRDDAARTVNLAGPVSAMEEAFGVKLFRVKQHDDHIYRGRVGDVFIPKALDGVVTGVFGLDSRPMVKRGRRLSLDNSHSAAAPRTGCGSSRRSSPRSISFPPRTVHIRRSASSNLAATTTPTT